MREFNMTTLLEKDYIRIPYMMGQLNTMRKNSDQYHSMNVGDIVHMSYVANDTVVAKESFRVSRMIIGPFNTIVSDFWAYNHALVDSESEMYEIMRNCYGEIDPNDKFLVIY